MSPRGQNLKARYVWIYSVRWTSPYTAPPEDQPRELVNEVSPTNGIPPALLALVARHPGYGICCDVISSREKARARGKMRPPP